MKPAVVAIALLSLVAAAPASADEQAVALKDMPGHDVVENNCQACHSLDYPRTNAPFLDRKGWQAEVDKMIKVFGAEIQATDAAMIVDYLAKNYGTGG